MTTTNDNGLNRTFAGIKGTITLASLNNSASISTAGFDTIVYTTRSTPVSGVVSMQMIVDLSGTPTYRTIPTWTGLHVQPTNAGGGSQYGCHKGPLPATFRFRNTSSGSLTIDYELRKTAAMDRGH